MNMLAIALSAWKQFVRDRIFYVVLIVALLMIGFSYLLATLTIVESRKILLDFCFSAASLAGGLTAIYIGIIAVAKEIEQKTIYTIVTKPISRSAYFIGKFLGSVAVLATTHIFLSVTIIGILSLMEEAVPPGFWPCMFLVFLENSLLLGFAFLCSSFTGSLLASGLTFAFFLIGRSNDSLRVMSERGLTSGVRYLAKTLYFIMPNLERYNIRDVVAYGRPFPSEMLGLGIGYTAAYLLACLAATCLILNSRDLP